MRGGTNVVADSIGRMTCRGGSKGGACSRVTTTCKGFQLHGARPGGGGVGGGGGGGGGGGCVYVRVCVCTLVVRGI